MTGKITRRKAIAGTLALFGTGTYGFVSSSDRVSAKAEIQSGEFTIPDKSYSFADGDVNTVQLSADVSYAWDANIKIDRVELSLAVGLTADRADIIARYENTEIAAENQDTTHTLTGDIMESGDFDSTNFNPSSGTKTTSFTAVIELILYRDGEIIATDALQNSAEIAVTKENIDLSGDLSADGTITIES